MKKILGLMVILIFQVASSSATSFSDNITVPHTFSAGETISSSKMNENIGKLYDEINYHIQIP